MKPARLRTKITLSILLAFSTLQVGSLVGVYVSTQKTVSHFVEKQLKEASGLIQNQIQAILDERIAQVQRIATDKTFIDLLKNHQNLDLPLSAISLRLNHTRIIVLDSKGQVIQSSGPLEHPYLGSFNSLFTASDPIEPSFHPVEQMTRLGVEVINQQIWGCLGTPIVDQNKHLGWLVVALPMDNSLTQTLKSLSGVGYELSFIVQNETQGWEAFASTLDNKVTELNKSIKNVSSLVPNTFTLSLENSDYLNLMIPLTKTLTGVDVAIILHYNLATALEPFNPIFLALVASILLALILGITGAQLINSQISRPLQALKEAIERVRQGHYSQTLVVSNDEFGEIGARFNEMSSTIAKHNAAALVKQTTDPVTRLDNRESFINKATPYLEIDLGRDQVCLVLVIRIDNYNAVNSTLGMAVGNEMMQACSKQLVDRFKHDCIIGRIDNEKLGLFVANITESTIFTFCEMVMRVLDTPFVQASLSIDTIPAIGVSCFPRDGKSMEELLQHAEIALFSAPKTFDRISYYQTGQDAQTKLQLSLMSELRKGIVEGEISIAFQPKIHLKANRLDGVESLIRWNHPTRGLISPAEFIPMAEHTGQILQLSQWILQQTIRQLAVWQDEGYTFNVSVNLSAKDLQSRNLASRLDYAVREAKIPHERLVLEITESYVMHDPKNAIDVLSTLKNMNFKLAIDDFGTGHSSLAYLKNLPVHELKIDMSYIENLKDDAKNQSIVQAIIMVAQNLNLHVTAEGIENEFSHKMLLDFGCDLGQGYFYCGPLNLEQLNAWLKTSPYVNKPNKSTQLS